MAAFLDNTYTDDKCRIQVDVNGSLRQGKYYGWVKHEEAGINACVLAGEYTAATKRFCLLFPVSINNGSSTGGDTSLDVNDPVPRMCSSSELTSVSDLASYMTANKSFRRQAP